MLIQFLVDSFNMLSLSSQMLEHLISDVCYRLSFRYCYLGSRSINVIDWKHLQFLPAGQGDRAAHPFQVVPKTQNVVVYCKLHF